MSIIASSESILAEEEVTSVSELAPEDFRRNEGSYKKRKAKKQVGAEITVEDLRGMNIIPDLTYSSSEFESELESEFEFEISD
jgi:hypothetical protein